jgi:hypothetical protein
VPAEQWAQGNQNVQITGVGPGASIQVSIGTAPPVRMPLLQAVVPPGAGASPARLLRARAGVLPFVDRAGLVSGLDAWMARPDPFATYLVGGRGGAGKTRLGVHLCMQAEARGWVCGLLAPKADSAELAALAHLQSPRLIVVDYAESRTEQLEVLLPFLAAQGTAQCPVRVLLLVRASPRTGQDWTAPLRIRRGDELEQILDETEVQDLEDLPLDAFSREALFSTAAEAFTTTQLPSDHSTKRLAPVDLSGAAFASPLLITIAAYLAVHDPDRAVPASREALLAELTGHEDKYWQKSAETAQVQINAENLRAQVVALATLAGADTQQDAAQLLALLPPLADATAERRYELAGWVNGQYPGPRWWNPLEPDLLGEYLVARHLTGLPWLLAGVLRQDNAAALAQPLDLYARAAVDYPLLAEALQPVLEDTLVELCQAAIDHAATQTNLSLLLGVTTAASALARLLGVINVGISPLRKAADLFPAGANQILSPLSLALASRLAENYHRLADADLAAHQPNLAKALDNLAIQLAQAGRREEALAASQEAVEVYRPLARANAAYQADLARSLNNLSADLGDAGRREDALAASQEAVGMYRWLAQHNPAAYQSDLASSLNNMSIQLGDAGRRADALAASQESVGVYRWLAQHNPAAYQADLARSLNNMSADLGDAGRWEEGLVAIQEAVEIRRRLAQANPAAYQPDLASSVHNLSVLLSEIDRWEEGLTAIEEAVEIRRRLAQANPTAYQPVLALSLNNLSVYLGEAGRREEGLAAIQEAVEVYRRLAQHNPAAYQADLARSLNNLSNALAQLGRHEEALASKNEAEGLHSTLDR